MDIHGAVAKHIVIFMCTSLKCNNTEICMFKMQKHTEVTKVQQCKYMYMSNIYIYMENIYVGCRLKPLAWVWLGSAMSEPHLRLGSTPLIYCQTKGFFSFIFRHHKV